MSVHDPPRRCWPVPYDLLDREPLVPHKTHKRDVQMRPSSGFNNQGAVLKTPGTALGTADAACIQHTIDMSILHLVRPDHEGHVVGTRNTTVRRHATPCSLQELLLRCHVRHAVSWPFHVRALVS